MEHPQPGDTFPVHMGWRLPDGNQLRVMFEVQVEAVELEMNRMRCQLLSIQAAGGSRPESEVDPLYFELVLGLVGRRAMIPLDARQGIVLPLRLATLMGQHAYFFDLDEGG
jgi:hypothetical protein